MIVLNELDDVDIGVLQIAHHVPADLFTASSANILHSLQPFYNILIVAATLTFPFLYPIKNPAVLNFAGCIIQSCGTFNTLKELCDRDVFRKINILDGVQ